MTRSSLGYIGQLRPPFSSRSSKASACRHSKVRWAAVPWSSSMDLKAFVRSARVAESSLWTRRMRWSGPTPCDQSWQGRAALPASSPPMPARGIVSGRPFLRLSRGIRNARPPHTELQRRRRRTSIGQVSPVSFELQQLSQKLDFQEVANSAPSE